MPPASHRHQLHLRRAARLAAEQGHVASRRQLYEMGVTRWEIRSQVRAGRWTLVGDQSVHLLNGPLSGEGHLWAAVFQAGPRAQLDGAAALVAAGLERFTPRRIRVSVPRGARVRRVAAYDIRQTRRWDAEDAAPSGIPRTRPAVAAVRAALWAASDREAALLLTMTVQQGLARPEEVAEQALRVRRDRRRLLIHAVANDLLDGVRSLGELDVTRLLRARGLPEPDRQVLRRDGHKRYYLDLYWEAYGLVVEVDGIHHAWSANVVGDALRQNSLLLAGDRVLRIPLLGLRLEPDAFVSQIERALAAAGWARGA